MFYYLFRAEQESTHFIPLPAVGILVSKIGAGIDGCIKKSRGRRGCLASSLKNKNGLKDSGEVKGF